MYISYRTEYANQLHQLLVSISKHFYIRKDGLVTCQEKPIEVNFGNYRKSRKDHLVYYVLRDHYSGNLAFRIATVDKLYPLAAFLYEVWQNGDGELSFQGMPKDLWVPKTIATTQLFAGLQKLGVRADYPPSGFASGIRAIRDLEEQLFIFMGSYSDHTLENIARYANEMRKSMLSVTSQGDRRELWSRSLPPGHPRRPPAREDFLRAFAPTPDAPLPLLPLNGEGPVATPSGSPDRPTKSGKNPPAFSPAKLESAQRFLDGAYDAATRVTAIAIANKALRTSPYCVDAYNLLAMESRNRQEKVVFYGKAVEAGRTVLGHMNFEKYTGQFWYSPETRPFMRAMEGLARETRKSGKTAEAIVLFQEMLTLNPGDNQGIRYCLLAALLEEDRMAETECLIQAYTDANCAFAYGKALWSFCTAGSGGRSEAFLQEALQTNTHVPAYLLGDKFVPFQEPDYCGFGDESEAVWYAQHALKAWKQKPEALAWLREMAGHLRRGN